MSIQRQIRFRIWDTEKNEFFKPIYEAHKGELYDLSICLDGTLLRRTLEMPAEHSSRFPNRYIIQAFTGLTDCKGVEIYESDLVLDKAGRR